MFFRLMPRALPHPGCKSQSRPHNYLLLPLLLILNPEDLHWCILQIWNLSKIHRYIRGSTLAPSIIATGVSTQRTWLVVHIRHRGILGSVSPFACKPNLSAPGVRSYSHYHTRLSLQSESVDTMYAQCSTMAPHVRALLMTYPIRHKVPPIPPFDLILTNRLLSAHGSSS